MNRKQKIQLVLAGIAAVLIIVWLIIPVKLGSKILGILSNALLFLSVFLSYRNEEKTKNKDM